jgi:hypothetical protein
VTHAGHQTNRISGGKIVESWTNCDIYSHVLPDMQESAVAAMEDVLS